LRRCVTLARSLIPTHPVGCGFHCLLLPHDYFDCGMVLCVAQCSSLLLIRRYMSENFPGMCLVSACIIIRIQTSESLQI
jgi:hypothetical protein